MKVTTSRHPAARPLAAGVPDADAAYARAVAAGAVVIRPLQDTPYGSREFAVKDPKGHSWSAGTYDPWAKHE